MQETTVICDCCGEVMEEATEVELGAKLKKDGHKHLQMPDENIEINLEDVCDPCAYALESAISDVIIKRSPK